VPFLDPPAVAAWRHVDARDGFEVVFLSPHEGGWRIEGSTSAVEEGEPWTVGYVIDVDAGWRTRRAVLTNHARAGRAQRTIESDGAGHWTVDGAPAPELDGYVDVDLESSSFTNTFPVHRLAHEPGEVAPAPAVYVRADDLRVERLHQTYERRPGEGGRHRFHYTSPAFDTSCELVYDASGLVLDYPGIAVRTY
jgi:hypothetical protein